VVPPRQTFPAAAAVVRLLPLIVAEQPV